MGESPAPKANILIVDDTVENLQLLAQMLARQGYEARPVPSGKLALQAVRSDPPDLILLDINMPEMSGYEVCEALKTQDNSRDIPVIFISALSETMDKVKAFGVGGVDYVTKPFHFEEVQARVETHLALRRAQARIQESYAELQELERIRDSLVHMIVHDMRSPLTGMMMGLSQLKNDLAGRIDEDSAEDLSTAYRSSERLNAMANDLLDVSRLEEGKMPIEPQDCDLAALVHETTSEVCGGGSEREIHVDASTAVRVSCDEGLIRRVLENLIGNALHHTPRGGSLRISVSRGTAGSQVNVHDEGPGIPAEAQGRIFEKFGTVEARKNQEYHSSGLGLAYCKLAVEAHGGAIGVRSEPGRGSSFWFTLPGAR